ncbi:serine hydrolase domain-containing protein [Pseudonocardia alaniniphila]|uniref:Beta-lactamase family protein n=1 Tax=Pseudonocardia alaniniphila TaxID=75291 RepID=A0ABS9TEC4_9PSEU|nr:beta-lactamase family protein [Pseudonocardia alaniniphila]MCH6166906.1 beta-lactamase family protein [Pseudonocardia alaniniphila]
MQTGIGESRRRHRRGRLMRLAVCAVLLATAGCAANSTPESTGSAPTATAPAGPSVLKTIDPAALQATVDATAKELLIPGAVVVLRTPQGDFTTVSGTTLRGTESPPGADTWFRIASNTKTMTAAAIVLMAQEGKLQFTDPVSRYVPDVPNGENITLAQLLTMRSGLYNYTDAPELSAALDADPTRVWTPQEVLAIAFQRPPDFPPGAEYAYNNTNYALLGLVAEKIDGKPLATSLQDRLFAPQGLQQIMLPAIDSTSIPDPYSHGYMYGGSAFALVDAPYPPDMQAAARAGTLQPTDYTNQNSSYASAAGGAVATATDLATWIRALVEGRVFNADFQRQWLDSVQPEDPANPDGQQYGYGISQQRFAPNGSMYFHGGELPGFNSFIGYDPDNKVTLVIWTNLTVSLDSEHTANVLLLKVLDHVYPGIPLAPPGSPTPTTR